MFSLSLFLSLSISQYVRVLPPHFQRRRRRYRIRGRSAPVALRCVPQNPNTGEVRRMASAPCLGPRESFGSLSVHLPAYAVHKSPEGASALLIRLPAPDDGRESTQMTKPTEGGGAVYLSFFISFISAVPRLYFLGSWLYPPLTQTANSPLTHR